MALSWVTEPSDTRASIGHDFTLSAEVGDNPRYTLDDCDLHAAVGSPYWGIGGDSDFTHTINSIRSEVCSIAILSQAMINLGNEISFDFKFDLNNAWPDAHAFVGMEERGDISKRYGVLIRKGDQPNNNSIVLMSGDHLNNLSIALSELESNSLIRVAIKNDTRIDESTFTITTVERTLINILPSIKFFAYRQIFIVASSGSSGTGFNITDIVLPSPYIAFHLRNDETASLDTSYSFDNKYSYTKTAEVSDFRDGYYIRAACGTNIDSDEFSILYNLDWGDKPTDIVMMQDEDYEITASVTGFSGDTEFTLRDESNAIIDQQTTGDGTYLYTDNADAGDTGETTLTAINSGQTLVARFERFMQVFPVSYHWFYGDGTDAIFDNDDPHTHPYSTGVYDVKLKITLSNGEVVTICKPKYIEVLHNRENLFNADYINDMVSLHYGWNNTTSLGWSENAGKGWVLPESRAAMEDTTYLGKRLSMVWDARDDKQYVMNTSIFNGVKIYTDKCDIDCENGDEIRTEITTPEFNGSSESFTLKHNKTSIYVRSLEDGVPLDEDFVINLKLYDANAVTPVDYNMDINSDIENVFYYQTRNTVSNSYRRIGIETEKSGYLFSGFNSEFIVDDRDRHAAVNNYNEEKLLASPTVWLSRKYGHTVDRISGVKPVVDIIRRSGPDGLSDSGIVLQSDLELNNEALLLGSIMIWADKNTSPVVPGITLESVYEDDIWALWFGTGSIAENLVIPTGTILFDTRLYGVTLDIKVVEYYYKNLETFLPGM